MVKCNRFLSHLAWHSHRCDKTPFSFTPCNKIPFSFTQLEFFKGWKKTGFIHARVKENGYSRTKSSAIKYGNYLLFIFNLGYFFRIFGNWWAITRIRAIEVNLVVPDFRILPLKWTSTIECKSEKEANFYICCIQYCYFSEYCSTSNQRRGWIRRRITIRVFRR